MGQDSSKLHKTEVEELTAIFPYKDKSGTVSADEMTAIPELAMNPLAQRIVAVIDPDGHGINFKHFVSALSVFCKDTKRDMKLNFAFQIYDVDGDGFISTDDLFVILKLMVGSSLPDAHIQQVVDRTILQADTIDKDGCISYEEFKRSMFHVDLEKVLTIQF
ncbi:hypothetical protein SmJEL517_g03654 [Synchytrium microbalum]|uniref:Calcineurin subunit B n=1 Tax=Synchytrium microbalum TaxID=1806994 RepID=A0A507BXC5_9FUNG|nr:uncharacterized protein SmJEL517_g03654 [Synchytrium microbalum]TPX33447.1 hypothetical protein SmJEL517_g03654 [Synchytrium microbalum]